MRRRSKARHELGFWLDRRGIEGGRLEHGHYEHFFTEWFGLDRDFYAGKRVLDVGCGPRGSLEWASMAARRVGLDPLADAYIRELGSGEHAMEYVAAPVERIPEPDGAFDVVTSFNSLDHVDDVRAASREMLRVLAPGGTLLLAVDVNHEPTAMEPHSLGWDVLGLFSPPLAVVGRRDLERHDGGLFASMLADADYDMSDLSHPGVLVVRLSDRTPGMAYEVPDLPYDYDALEPHIDEATMRVHHDKHHQAYVDKANAALEGTEWEGKSIEEVLSNLSSLPSDKQGPVRNNGGGHHNHLLFWESMSPDGGGEPSGDLADAIASKFGSFDDFKSQFKDAGIARFGSGWAWLIADGAGGVDLVTTANQDSPLSDGQTPLLGCDVWEHAYYLKYQNKRPDYIDAWWNTVDWARVAERFAAAS